jgi:predicted tellurium resistance membrane protein TerC
VLGILMMRGVSSIFLKLIDAVPEMETTAYVLILIIAVKMGLGIIHFEVPALIFFAILIIAFGATFIVHAINKKKEAGKTA